LLKHDEINIVNDLWPLFVKRNSKSTWTHIVYRIKSSRVTYTYVCFLGIHNMYTFLHKKRNQLSVEQFFFKFVRYTPLINMFGSKSRTLTQQNSRVFSSTSFAHFV